MKQQAEIAKPFIETVVEKDNLNKTYELLAAKIEAMVDCKLQYIVKDFDFKLLNLKKDTNQPSEKVLFSTALKGTQKQKYNDNQTKFEKIKTKSKNNLLDEQRKFMDEIINLEIITEENKKTSEYPKNPPQKLKVTNDDFLSQNYAPKNPSMKGAEQGHKNTLKGVNILNKKAMIGTERKLGMLTQLNLLNQ
ncbi:hypothetical protein WA026_008401 [Henosepilachna vigintioctopunctata]|uniref:Uncharacterized protein n=1 Tax=Henosepilachna vigintioctopunctata TaxID=420089 RepID=A0AAW1UFT0_9CUCU